MLDVVSCRWYADTEDMKTTAPNSPKSIQAMVRETMGPGYQFAVPATRLFERLSHHAATASHPSNER